MVTPVITASCAHTPLGIIIATRAKRMVSKVFFIVFDFILVNTIIRAFKP
jgi:hypothetical protein